MFSTTGQEVREDLQDSFSQSNAPCIFQIKSDIACLAQDQMTVAAYYTRFKKLWDELGSYNDTICSCGGDRKRCKLMQFLMGPNESYSAIRWQILLLNPLPDFTKAYSSIMKEEKQRSLRATHEMTETLAMGIRREEPVALLPDAAKVLPLIPIRLIENLYITLIVIEITMCETHVGS